MKRILTGLRHALTPVLRKMRASWLAADATHRAILLRKDAEQLRLKHGNFNFL